MLELNLLFDAVADDGAETFDTGVDDGVVAAGAFGAPGDDAGIEEEAKVLAGVGLAHAEFVDNLADAEFSSSGEEAEDGEAAGIAHDAEALGDALEEGV